MTKKIERLQEFQKTQAAKQGERNRVELLRSRVPEGEGLERLLRYEASLERAFDRTLAQRERLQRLRLGQAVLPCLDVAITH